MYDCTNYKTFEALHFWINEIKQMVTTKYALFIVASKIDMSDSEEVSIREAGEYARSNGA